MEETNAGKANAATVEGTVKSFDQGRRYGFIAQEGGREVFVHQEAILDQGTIAAGDRVSFQVTEGPKGPRAASVRKL
jgi:CspA family cold shock protein